VPNPHAPSLSHLRIATVGPTHYLQHLILDGLHDAERHDLHDAAAAAAGWRTLRPIQSGQSDKLLVAMGVPDSYELYDLDILLEALTMQPSMAFDDTMPEPAPMPEAMQYLSATTMTVLLRGAMGHSSEDIEAYLRAVPDHMPDIDIDLSEYRNDWESSSIYLLKSSAANPNIQSRKAQISAQIADGLATPASNENPSPCEHLPVSDGVKYNEVRKLTPEELALYESRLRDNYNQRRLKWPFSKMDVGDVVRIEAGLATKGQRAAHSYSSVSGKLFSTTRLRNGDLEVVRVTGFRVPYNQKRS
jgi:hypothetical protein